MDIRTQRLNEAFRASGLTQAEICYKTGITKGAMSSYLSGRYIPKQRTIELLADALNVTIPYLMGYDDAEYLIDDMIIEKIKKLSPKSRALLDSIVDTLLKSDEDQKG